MDSREIIEGVLEFECPDRIGLTYSDYEGQQRICDTIGVGPSSDDSFQQRRWEDDRGGEYYDDEWGCVWRRIKGRTTKGEVVEPPIESWDDLDDYQPPALDDPKRYEEAAEISDKCDDRYILGSLPGACFDRARYLRRFDNYLQDCAACPEQVNRLNKMVNDLILRQVAIYADIGVDGVFFGEDWGTERRLLVSPQMWDELFKWTFERLIGFAHARGLTVWMHSCGYVRDIIPPLVDIGMDAFQFDQPELHGLDWLSEFGDRVTYWCPIDIQTTLQSGDEATIKAKAREMVKKLGANGGGFIAKDYGDNHSIGVDPLWQHWGYEEFLRVGRYEGSEVAAVQ